MAAVIAGVVDWDLHHFVGHYREMGKQVIMDNLASMICKISNSNSLITVQKIGQNGIKILIDGSIIAEFPNDFPFTPVDVQKRLILYDRSNCNIIT